MTNRPTPRRRPEPDQARAERASHLLQRRHSILQALTDLSRDLKPAYTAVTAGNPSVPLLEKMQATIELALREAQSMAGITGEAAA